MRIRFNWSASYKFELLFKRFFYPLKGISKMRAIYRTIENTYLFLNFLDLQIMKYLYK